MNHHIRATSAWRPLDTNPFGEIDDVLLWMSLNYNLKIEMESRGCDIRIIFYNKKTIIVNEPTTSVDNEWCVFVNVDHKDIYSVKSRKDLFKLLNDLLSAA